jgi:hypothetical protein
MVLEHWLWTQAKDLRGAIGRVPGSGVVPRSPCWLNPNPFWDLPPTLAAGHSGMGLLGTHAWVEGALGGRPRLLLLVLLLAGLGVVG